MNNIYKISHLSIFNKNKHFTLHKKDKINFNKLNLNVKMWQV
jgi:hypothetical protein